MKEHLSTDRVRAYKPDPRAYQMGLDAFGLTRQEIAFAASASWDAVGAKAFGYPTIWVNRAGLSAEEWGSAPDVVGAGMADLLKFTGPSHMELKCDLLGIWLHSVIGAFITLYNQKPKPYRWTKSALRDPSSVLMLLPNTNRFMLLSFIFTRRGRGLY